MSRSATTFWRSKNIKPTSEAIGGYLISFRLYKPESSLAVSNIMSIMSGLFLKVPELVLRNLLCLSEKCKQICLAADTYEVQIVLRFRLFPSLPTVLRHSERNSSFDKSQWQPPRRVLPNFSKLFSFVKDMQKLPDPKEMRMVLYEGAAERMNTPVYNRDEMVPGIELSGPAIIEEMDSTTVIPPRWIARIDEYNNIRLAYEGDK